MIDAIACSLYESDKFGGFKCSGGRLAYTLRSQKVSSGVIEFNKGDCKMIENNNIEYRIRKLTEKECWRLMDFSDEDFKKAQDVGMSKSQGYKSAGNSIVVGCVELLAEHLYKSQYDNSFVCRDEK